MADTRPPPFFIGDDLALDFLNSLATPWGAEIEWLGTGGDFVAWLEQAHAVPAKVSPHFRAHAEARALDAVASQARGVARMVPHVRLSSRRQISWVESPSRLGTD